MSPRQVLQAGAKAGRSPIRASSCVTRRQDSPSNSSRRCQRGSEQARRDTERQQKQIQVSHRAILRAHPDDGTCKRNLTLRTIALSCRWFRTAAQVYGVIHGASGSGHTLFVNRSNHRSEMSWSASQGGTARSAANPARDTELLQIACGKNSIHSGYRRALELLFAKAEFAIASVHNSEIQPASSRRLTLKEARHPLLE